MPSKTASMKDRVETPVTFQSKDAQIFGVWHRCSANKLIIMCHGFMGNKIENKRLFVETARELNNFGIDAFRFDFYGSGDSAGEFMDSRITCNIANLKDAFIWAEDKGYKDIAVLGISMGAATLILSAQDINAKAFVLWSTVPDMKKVFAAYSDDAYEINSQKGHFEYKGWIITKAFWEDAIQYDISKSFARIKNPKFIVQGTADSPLFVQGFNDFRKIAIPPADFMEIPNACHTFQTVAHRRQLIRQTVVWLKRHFNRSIQANGGQSAE